MTLRRRTNTSGLSGAALRWAVTATAVVGFSFFGFDQGVMSGIITGEKFNEEFPATAGTSHYTVVIQGAVTSCYELGCFVGALFAMFRGEKIGRRPLVLIGAIIITIGTTITCSAMGPHWGLGQFVVGRVITGVGNGMNTATIPVWQSEMSKPENRGRLVNLEGAIIAVGTFIAYWLDFGLSFVNSSIQWRFPIAFQIIFALLLFFLMWGMPESPRWLVGQNRLDEAAQILAALWGTDANDPTVVTEIRLVAEAIHRETGEVSLKDVLAGGKQQNLRRMLLGASTQLFQQFTGCNAAIYYSTVLFKNSMKLGNTTSLVMGGVFATVYALSTIPSFFLVDRIGRRKLFMIGALGQGLSFTITFACLTHESKQTSKGAAVGLYLFIFFFAISILGLPWIYPPEINPNRTRTVATSISTCTNWLSNFAVVMFTPIFIANSGTGGWGCYCFFACVNFLYVPFIYFLYPETAGRSLEEMDIIFAKGYSEKINYVEVANEMPKLSDREVEEEAVKYGLYDISHDSEPEKEQYTNDSDA
jgi:sugar porter (SP) family MFS transporter